MNETPSTQSEFPSELTHEVLSRGVCLRGGSVLLCRQVGSKRSFLPGGHIDPGEGGRAALEREIREELGLESSAGAFLGGAEHRFCAKGEWTWELNFLFALDIRDLPAGDPTSQEPWQEFFWWPVDRLAEVGFEPAVLRDKLGVWAAEPGTSHFASTYEEESSL